MPCGSFTHLGRQNIDYISGPFFFLYLEYCNSAELSLKLLLCCYLAKDQLWEGKYKIFSNSKLCWWHHEASLSCIAENFFSAFTDSPFSACHDMMKLSTTIMTKENRSLKRINLASPHHRRTTLSMNMKIRALLQRWIITIKYHNFPQHLLIKHHTVRILVSCEQWIQNCQLWHK